MIIKKDRMIVITSGEKDHPSDFIATGSPGTAFVKDL